jgi:hypothetical protein
MKEPRHWFHEETLICVVIHCFHEGTSISLKHVFHEGTTKYLVWTQFMSEA